MFSSAVKGISERGIRKEEIGYRQRFLVLFQALSNIAIAMYFNYKIGLMAFF